MLQSMLVIDDFYTNPEEVRHRILNFSYPERAKGDTYPGRNSKEAMLPPQSDQIFSRILQEPVIGAPGSWHGVCRISLAADQRVGEVHIDQGCCWAGIIYLSLDRDCQGGTEFYRHKQYRSDRAPLTNEEARRVYGCETPADVIGMLTGEGKDSRNLSKWELIATLPMRFNRLVLFRPWFWHRTGADFGTRPENGRLIQLLFLAPAPGTKGAGQGLGT